MAKPYFRKDTNTWYVLHGREKIKVGKSERAAKHLADKINVDNAEGKVGLYHNRDKSIEEFFTEFLAYKKNVANLRPKSITRYHGIVNNFLSFLRTIFSTVTNLSQLNQTIFERYAHYRKNTPVNRNGLPVTQVPPKNKKNINLRPGASERTVKFELEILKSMLDTAVKNHDPHKRFLMENPLQYMEPIKVNGERPKRPLTKEEVVKFLSYLKGKSRELYEIFLTLIHTGLRDGEMRHLEWSDVDFNKRFIILREKTITYPDGTTELWRPKTKKGKREIPIHDDLFKVLSDRKKRSQNTSTFVFPDKDGGILTRRIREDMIRTMRAIGIDDFTRVHDLRRTFISLLAEAGVPRETTMDIVGHVDEETYELYRESSLQHRRDSVNKLDFTS